MKNTITLCMIVKNEEEVLERCLTSVKSHIDEMIIVDTGSTDKTKEIALKYGAKVYDFIWTNDFSEARNYALEKATSDWILQLDADEYFIGDEAKKIRKVIEKEDVDGYSLQIHNFIDEKTIGSKHTNIRLFKNVKGMKYISPIHEMITINNQNLQTEICNINIMHEGYIHKIVSKKNKRKRNLSLLKKELKKNPNNPAMNYYMGNEYSVKKPELANTYYEKALKYSTGTDLEHNVYHYYLRTLIQTNQEEKCLEIIKKAKEKYPNYNDLYMIEGEIYEEFGRWQDAKKIYTECLGMKTPPKKYLSAEGVDSFIPMEKLMTLAIKERNWNEAISWGIKLLEKNKYQPKAVVFFHLLNSLYGEERASELLEKLYNEENRNDLIMKFKTAFYIRSSIVLPKLVDKMEEDDILPLLFYYHYFLGDYKNAKQILKEKKENTKDWKKLFIIYFHETKDKISVSEVQNDTFQMIINYIENKELGKDAKYDEEFYLDVIEESLKLKKFVLFEELLSLSHLFEKNTLKKIAYKLYEYFHDDIAIETLTAYINKEKDSEALSELAQWHFNQKNYYEAMTYAQMGADGNSFKPYEIILKSSMELGENAIVKELATNLHQEIKDSSFLNEIIAKYK